MRTLAAVLFAGACLAAGTNAAAATFYVSPGGDDAAAGTREQPWRTVARVNEQRLRPGDTVLLKGGRRFAGPLVPWGSGSASAPVRFASYGKGRAAIASPTHGAVWFPGNRHVVLEDLLLTSAGGESHVIASNPDATTAFVTIRDSLITDSHAFGINSPSLADHDWTIEDNTIWNTHETGVTFRGARFTVRGNTIVGTGTDPSEGAHGVYAKGPYAKVLDNDIRFFSASGVSIRYRDSIVRGNRIANGLIGISSFQEEDARAGGRSLIAGNTIRNVTEAGIYLDGSTLESFTIANNTIAGRALSGLSVHAVRALTITGNHVSGPFGKFALVVQKPRGSYVERNNSWSGARGRVFGWNGRVLDFAGYRRASGQGAGDTVG